MFACRVGIILQLALGGCTFPDAARVLWRFCCKLSSGSTGRIDGLREEEKAFHETSGCAMHGGDLTCLEGGASVGTDGERNRYAGNAGQLASAHIHAIWAVSLLLARSSHRRDGPSDATPVHHGLADVRAHGRGTGSHLPRTGHRHTGHRFQRFWRSPSRQVRAEGFGHHCPVRLGHRGKRSRGYGADGLGGAMALTGSGRDYRLGSSLRLSQQVFHLPATGAAGAHRQRCRHGVHRLERGSDPRATVRGHHHRPGEHTCLNVRLVGQLLPPGGGGVCAEPAAARSVSRAGGTPDRRWAALC